MRRTQKNKSTNKFRKNKSLHPASGKLFFNITVLALLVLLVTLAGWFGLKAWTKQRYPDVYTQWWKSTLIIKKDFLAGKRDVGNAQKWLKASDRLLSMETTAKWAYHSHQEWEAFDALQHFMMKSRNKPDKLHDQAEAIISIQQSFTTYHRNLGLTQPVFLVDRLVFEWNQLKRFSKENSSDAAIEASIHQINMLVPLLKSHWLPSDINDFSMLGSTCQELFLNGHVNEIFQLCVDNDSFLIQACLDGSY